MDNNDSVHESNKLDYYSILKRRKRTVESFIAEHGIVSLEDLDNVLRELGKEYDISEDFRKLAVKSLPLVPLPVETPVELPELSRTTQVDAVQPDTVVDAHVYKHKKRTKKEN